MLVPGVQPNRVIMPIVKSANSSKAKAAAKLGALGLTPWALAEMMREPKTEVIKQYAGSDTSTSCEDSSLGLWRDGPGYDVC